MLRHAAIAAVIMPVALSVILTAQRGGQQPGQPGAAPAPPPAARTTAPLDLEGYWVSVVTEDWRWRMMTPPRGDAPGVPLSLEGRRVANSWDLARDNSSGQQCKAFGAGGIMRIPGRIHITWENDNTLRMDFDAGKQTRLIHFAAAPRSEPSLQGHSVGRWEVRNTGRPILDEEAIIARGRGGRAGAAPRDKGSLKIVTTGMRAGYFRKNGLPYSDSAMLTEYFDRHDDFGSQWFTVLSVLEDSRYLISPFVTTTHFKREANGAKWSPQPCETLPPTTDRVSKGEEG